MKKWKVLNKVRKGVSQDGIIDILLKNRGIKTQKEKEEFLNPGLSYVNIKNVGIDSEQVKKAILRIKKTINERKKIVIYGDYDVDGICGAAILWETIYKQYKSVVPYIPHRIDEGYGLSIKGISNIIEKEKDVDLIITVDNGIVANSSVQYANENGIDVIITDHHVKSSKLPKAYAIIHSTLLCGAGVAYLLSKEIDKDENDSHLELVALATVADLVPLNRYNRALLKHGLKFLRETRRVGIMALFEEAKLDKSKVGTREIGHVIAPRLNASGRIAHAIDSLRLICTKNVKRARELAQQLGEVNRKRQSITVTSAISSISRIYEQKTKLENILIVSDKEYAQGVIGLIASRLAEEFFRPSIAISIGEEFSKGSARSIRGVDIIEMIRTSSNLLVDAGGHPMAAGFTIETAKIELFREAILRESLKIKKELFNRLLTIDCEIKFDLIDDSLMQRLKMLEPFGIGNPKPIFATKGVKISSIRSVGSENKHLQLMLSNKDRSFKGIVFNYASETIKTGDVVDIAYSVEENEWRGNRNVELKIEDIKQFT